MDNEYQENLKNTIDSYKRQLRNYKSNLMLIEERISQFVLSVDIDLNVLKQERETKEKIKIIEEDIKEIEYLLNYNYRQFLYPLREVKSYFQNRNNEISWIKDFLNNAERIMIFVGRSGIGKSETVSQAIKTLTKNQNYTALVNITSVGYIRAEEIDITNKILLGLSTLLPVDKAKERQELYKYARKSQKEKVNALLSEFPPQNNEVIVVIIDDFEKIISPETQEILAPDLEETLCALRDYPYGHRVKVIIISQSLPRKLKLRGEEVLIKRLVDGLKSLYAENYLRQRIDLSRLIEKDKSEESLRKAGERLRGFPMALEALCRYLNNEYENSLSDLFDEAESSLYKNVTEAFIGKAFKRLDTQKQKLMQVLAIYNHPVQSHLIQRLLSIDSPHINEDLLNQLIKELIDEGFVLYERYERNLYYYLHQEDYNYVFSQMQRAIQLNLLNHAGDYLKELRQDSANMQKIDYIPQQVQLALLEFDIRYRGEEYEKAAWAIIDIGSVLIKLGNYQIVAEPHERLQGKINNKYLQSLSMTDLGTAYTYLGKYDLAITLYKKALNIAREIENRELEGKCLNNLANCFYEQKQMNCAIEKFRDALDLARKRENQELEGKCLNNLGICLYSLGQVDEAMSHHQSALTIARNLNDQKLEGSILIHLGICDEDKGQFQLAIDRYKQVFPIVNDTNDRELAVQYLCNRGNCFAALGEFDNAIKRFEKALEYCQTLGYKSFEATIRHSLAEVLIDINHLTEALEQAQTGFKISDDFNNSKTIIENSCALARAYLYTNNLTAARTQAESAQKYDVPKARHYALALLGLITLLDSDRTAACVAFEESQKLASELLQRNGSNYAALNTKGLALCGLVICGKQDYLPDAKQAYQQARIINNGAVGITARTLHLFEKLAILDEEKKLRGILEIILGIGQE
ncbi:hypothetical protein BV378_38135 [Nostoc sp. RF31YmG]|nr:hypothetical protein BV378_38135 [Nostoc sp. RF31YmG]